MPTAMSECALAGSGAATATASSSREGRMFFTRMTVSWRLVMSMTITTRMVSRPTVRECKRV